ncbi:MAG: hypothetical protein GKR94_33390 [Gammaproteobacteria bacterium]|nr:hypothetical protein [Gammaproteobacteria bacterium]
MSCDQSTPPQNTPIPVQPVTWQQAPAKQIVAEHHTTEDRAGDEALNALGALEEILDSRKDLVGDGVATNDGQYTIPLLDEVLRPGYSAGRNAEQVMLELSPRAQQLFDRLASEIDVIVQSGVDEALKAAAKHIRAKIKQHVAIVLPEILDELTHQAYDSPPDLEARGRD